MDETSIRLRAQQERRAVTLSDSTLTIEELLKRAFTKHEFKIARLSHGDPTLKGAYAVIHRDYGSVFIDKTLSRPRHHFILAHEYAHLILHSEYQREFYLEDESHEAQLAFSMQSQTSQIIEGYSPAELREREANLFAAEFLLPTPLVHALFTQEKFRASEIATRLGVSLPLVYSQIAHAVLISSTRLNLDDIEKNEDSIHRLTPVNTDYAKEPNAQSPIPSASPAQKAAAEAEEPVVLVDAGPGTGKTRTLIARIVWLIRKKNVVPEHILALTYTNRAAEEMRSRLVQEIGDAARRVWVGTYHAFGYEILKKEAAKLGLPPRPTLLDPADAALLLESIHFQLGLTKLHYSHDPTLTHLEILDCVSRAKDKLLTPDDFRALVEAKRKEAQTEKENVEAEKWCEVASAYSVYQKHLQEQKFLDFGDLLMRPLALFDAYPEVAKAWSEQYPYLLADEYQDVNLASIELLKRFVANGSRLWTVGDARQAIYHFRGATPQNIARFKTQFPQGKLYRLQNHYRSVSPILELVNCAAKALQSEATGQSWEDWVSERAETEETAQSVSRIALYEADSEAEQTAFLIAQIRAFEAQGVALQDQAVLLYTNKACATFSTRLERAGVPVQHVGSLFDRPEIKDLLALIEFVAGYDSAFWRVAKLPRYALTEAEVVSLFQQFHRKKSDRIATLLNEENVLDQLSETGREGIERLLTDLAEWKTIQSTWHFLCELLFERSRFLDHFAEEGQARRAIYHFLALAQGMMSAPALQNSDNPLATFLIYLQRLRKMETRSKRFSLSETTTPGIQILTMHSAKGLEFRAVHLPDLDESLFARKGRAQYVSPHFAETEIEVEPDRFLFFVALSRGRDYLSLSRSKNEKGKQIGALPELAQLNEFLEQYRITAKPEPGNVSLSDQNISARPRFESTSQTLSFYGLKHYQECPRSYFYRDVLRLPIHPPRSSYVKAHQVMRDLLKLPTFVTLSLSIEARFAELWQTSFPEVTDETERLRQEMVGLLPEIEKVVRSRPLSSEKTWFELTLAGRTFQVAADYAEAQSDGSLLIEKYYFRERKTKADHLDAQLTALRLAAEQQDKPAKIRLRYFGLSDDFEPTVQKRAEQNRIDDFEEALKGIRQNEFPASPNDKTKCLTCEFFSICPD